VVAEGLRRRGVDCLTVQEAGRSGLSDPDQLAFARTEGRVLVTMDSDFLVLTSRGVSHAGIAYANPNRSIGDLITASMLLFEILTPAEMTNHVEFL
jgi:hypothetical protein